MVSSEAESLRRVVREIDADIKKLDSEREEKRKAAATDFGPQRAFFALQDQCIEKKIEKYTYKLCAFKEVKQDYTLLGTWDKWGANEDKPDYARMLFVKGHKCWNGPERYVRLENDDRTSVGNLMLTMTFVTGRWWCSSSAERRMRSLAWRSRRRASTR